MYKLYVRDSNFNRVAEIDDYIKLELTIRFNAVGAWVLDLPTNTDATRELIQPQAGIIVVRDGTVIFSGPANQRERNWKSDEDTMTVSGFDDNVVLARNLAYPVPSGPPYTASDYDVRTGPGETVMKAYINANIGASARAGRQLDITTETDNGLGATVTGRARFNTFLELFTPLALAAGDLGFKVIQSNSALQFQVYQPDDKTRSVLFSPMLGNLLDFKYNDSDPDSNYLIAGGTGDGTARIFAEHGDSSSVATYGRFEAFLDKRDTSSMDELNQGIDAELSQTAVKTSLTITPIDTESISFMNDYQLGDKVSIVLTQPNEVVTVEDMYYFLSAYQMGDFQTKRVQEVQTKLSVIQDVVREVKITIDTDGETINPTIGTPDSLAHPILGIFSKMKRLDKRVSNVERK